MLSRKKYLRIFFLFLGFCFFFSPLAQAAVCDVDTDYDVDRDDINLIVAARNTPASGSDDPRDADGDGRITGLDARRCVLQCTLPRCEVITPDAKAVIGPEGGVVEIEASTGSVLRIEVPEGAVIEDTNIAVNLIEDKDVNIPGATPLFPQIDLRPDGIVFEKPIYLTYKLMDETILNAGITSLDEVRDYLRAYYLDKTKQIWTPLNISEVSSDRNEVVVVTNHFTKCNL